MRKALVICTESCDDLYGTASVIYAENLSNLYEKDLQSVREGWVLVRESRANLYGKRWYFERKAFVIYTERLGNLYGAVC